MRVLIVDDEAPARSRLRRLLDPFVAEGRLDPPDEATDGVDALARMDAAPEPYGLVFLDVRMPELDGFDVLDRLRPDHRPAVVFTTAYDEYALRAFEASAVDYLLKPIDAGRLAEAVARAEALTGSRRAAPAGPPADTADARVDRLADLLDRLDRREVPPAAEAPLRQFTVQGSDRLFVVDADDLVAAVVVDGLTQLHVRTPGGAMQRHLVSFTLDALEARLDPTRTMRVHRGALVRLGAVRELVPWFSGRYKLVLDGGLEVVASRARSRDLRDRLAL
ncbi:MAG TPA: LytTR family DNA-binding domain-containing protein [Rubricoccaceae bacterium]|jgi:two-component system LytT family response regulator